MIKSLTKKAARYLDRLCIQIDTRQVGHPGNQAATDYFACKMENLGFLTERPTFECIDWVENGAYLEVEGQSFTIFASPYSMGIQATAPLAAVNTIEKLQELDVYGKIILLSGAIASEQLMPKNFPFYNPDYHQQIIHLLETKQPKAIIAATSRNPAVAGAIYPFPLFEDGDFDIPSAYMTDIEGLRLAQISGSLASLEINAHRIPATGCNVEARKGPQSKRIALTAHIDAKIGTPGALDNAAGVVTLMLLAELFSDYSKGLGIEIVALNGEDYYGANGEKLYIARNQGHFDRIMLNINIDGAGYIHGKTAYSMYNCPPNIVEKVQTVFSKNPTLVPGKPWYQSDHSIFIQQNVPALALTTDQFETAWSEIAHTEKDKPDLVDSQQLASIAQSIHDLVLHLGSVRTYR